MEDTQDGTERTNTEPVQQTDNRTAEETGKKREGRFDGLVIFLGALATLAFIIWLGFLIAPEYGLFGYSNSYQAFEIEDITNGIRWDKPSFTSRLQLCEPGELALLYFGNESSRDDCNFLYNSNNEDGSGNIRPLVTFCYTEVVCR